MPALPGNGPAAEADDMLPSSGPHFAEHSETLVIELRFFYLIWLSPRP